MRDMKCRLIIAAHNYFLVITSDGSLHKVAYTWIFSIQEFQQLFFNVLFASNFYFIEFTWNTGLETRQTLDFFPIPPLSEFG